MILNFLGIDPRFANYRESRFAVLPIPYDATVSYQSGTRAGPQAILSASQQVELYDDELSFEPYRTGVCTLDPVEPVASGPSQMHEVIFKASRKPVRDGKFLFALGGEHGVTSGLVRAVATKHKKLSILQIDAHLDLRDQYEGSPFSHASVMRRCLEHVDRVVPVGIRNVAKEEAVFLKKSGIKPIFARDCQGSNDWIESVLERLGDSVYVTIDIDAFDPGFAPGTGTPEPGGLDWYQVTGLLRRVAAAKRIVAADIVEVLPIPGQVVTEFLAARLAYRLMAYVVAAESGRL
ncbi:MAG: agmatinase [Planctomycetes bacterium]|nr:agmatinase [Planctomycetota bacterium]